MMLSSTYQASSRAGATLLSADPENRFLARMNRQRLEAESIRDTLLFVAGRLDATLGGPAVAEVANPRRSLYLMSTRTGAKTSEFGPLFDAPDCGAIIEQRTHSTVAPQALFLMNDPFVIDLATSLAKRVTEEVSAADDANANRAFVSTDLPAALRPRMKSQSGSNSCGTARRPTLGRVTPMCCFVPTS